jgi:hypothetical protein
LLPDVLVKPTGRTGSPGARRSRVAEAALALPLGFGYSTTNIVERMLTLHLTIQPSATFSNRQAPCIRDLLRAACSRALFAHHYRESAVRSPLFQHFERLLIVIAMANRGGIAL